MLNFRDYENIPQHMRGIVRDYVNYGYRPGSFLYAILCNRLTDAVNAADQYNIRVIPEWAAFIMNEIPSMSWHNEAAVEYWIQLGGLEGLKKKEQENAEENDKEKV